MPQSESPSGTFGARLQQLRTRRGMSREVFGGLLGRSGEWVKAIERGRLLMPRYPILLRMAEVLQIDDLAELTSSDHLLVETVTRGSHDEASTVADAMHSAAPTLTGPPNLDRLAGRVDDAWRRWTTIGDQKTAVAELLPGLLGEARAVVRALDGSARRRALAELSRLYVLTGCYWAWQPAGELVWLSADRALAAAEDADDPYAIAAATWYYGEVYRSAGQAERAAGSVVAASELLDPARGSEDRARWGQLQLSAAQSEAQLGRAGNAWRYWDQASRAADALGEHYVHPWLRFGRVDVDGFALRIETRLFRSRDALRRADRYDLAALPSPGRRGARLLDIAEAHRQQREHVSAVHMIGSAYRESPETVRYSLWARQALLEMSAERSSVRRDARELAAAIGLAG
jgi:transcriptional regulator with XRE-family HTH domain